MSTSTNASPFTHCLAGHSLAEPDAYIYRLGGARDCRQCVIKEKGARARTSGWRA